MCAVQTRRNVQNTAFFLNGNANGLKGATFAQDAARATTLARYTVMAQNTGTKKWVPLTEVDPAGVPAKLTCGALGSGLAAFEAITDGSFQITVDGEAISITGLDFTGIEAPNASPARGVCGALGTTPSGFQAVSDGAFQITVNGVAHDITGLDFSAILDPDAAPATGVCGANGANLAAWQAVANGAFQITVNGVAHDITGLDFSSITALDEIVDTINSAVEGKQFLALYDSAGDYVTFVSTKTGTQSTITALTAGSAGTDISGAGFLNGLTGTITLTQGTGFTDETPNIADIINAAVEEAQFHAVYDGSAITFVSNLRGAGSTITALTAGSAGTDISGAGYLNGLTGTITLTQGDGDDGTDRNIADVINEAADGRFICQYNGTRVEFLSPTTGGESAITVLTAGAAGTDISGASYLNGLTGTGTVTAATGFTSENTPAGIYLGEDIAAADLVAGDVADRLVLIGGNVTVNDDDVVYEGSLTKDSIVVHLQKRVEQVLADLGIFLGDVVAIDGYENT